MTARRRVGALLPAVAVTLLTSAAALTSAACGGGRQRTPAGRPAPGARGGVDAADPTAVYRRAGLLAEPGPVPFVGAIKFLAGASRDSTLMLLSVSMANHALTFVREGDRYRAGYQVTLDVRPPDAAPGAASVRRVDTRQTVRVASFRETTRTDESIIFHQYLRLAPGRYALVLNVRDAESAKASSEEIAVTVPALGDGRLSSVIPVYEAAPRRGTDSVPALVPSPRATAVFGRDSVFTVYLEAYGAEPTPVQLVVRDDRGTALWSDTARLPQRGALASGTVALPVSRLGVGITTLVASHGTAGDTVRTPLFVGFGESLPVSSFEEMLSYLRYFATPEQLKALREAPPDRRAAAWAAFLRETDPVLSTPEHEGLRDYFARVEQANQRFREEGIPGWLTDRGMVFIALGEPDQVFEQGGTDLSQRGRAQIWEFSQYHAQLVFIDQTGFNRWRLTASSEAEFQSIVRRKQRNQS